MKTVGLGMEEINGNVEGVIDMVQSHESVEKVLDGSVKSQLNYDIDGGEGEGDRGVMGFEVKDSEGGKKVIEGREYLTLGESLGGVERLI